MNNPASISAALPTQSVQTAQAERPTSLWGLAAAFVVITLAVLVADGSLTPAHRIAVFMQSGMFP